MAALISQFKQWLGDSYLLPIYTFYLANEGMDTFNTCVAIS